MVKRVRRTGNETTIERQINLVTEKINLYGETKQKQKTKDEK